MAGKTKNRFLESMAELKEVNLNYVSQGKGPLALLLHGFPEFWYSWRFQIPFLAKKFLTVAPDLRGYHKSDKPRGVSSYNIDRLMGDVDELISYFSADKCTLIGHDWGGVIAWYYAAMNPDKVEKLIIMNAPHPVVFLRELGYNILQIMSSWYIFMFQLPKIPEMYIRRNDYEMIEKVFKGWAKRKDAFSDEDIEKYKDAISLPDALTSGINYYRALFRDPSLIGKVWRFPVISTPTMIIWAEDDEALTKRLTYHLTPYFSTSPIIRYISHCSHWVQQEQPELVNSYLKEFLF